jgi:lipid II:glycine glycyltransferase (peptidoglycan interpeptide bridge formation enzyme)
MIIRPITLEDRARYDQVAQHPLQSWAWGEFRRATGVEVERLGVFNDQGRLEQVVQVTFHPIPILGGQAGYIPKGPAPTANFFPALEDLGQRHHALFIKHEPNVLFPADQTDVYKDLRLLLAANHCQIGQALFTPYTFVLDLTPSEEELLANCKSKTRYNIRLAEKKGVTIGEDTTEQGMADYLRLLEETTERQNFYAHNRQYFETMWQVLGQDPMFHIFTARFEGQVISAWIVFIYNGVGYYPYGASSRAHKEVMANNLLMWEVLKFAKQQGCTSFDMWGALGPDPDPHHKWYGFHRFKEGYGAILMQSLGTYDQVIVPTMYSLFTLGNKLRWQYLHWRARFVRG